MDDALVLRIVEAALLASAQPLSLTELAALFPDDAPAPAGAVERALETLREQSEARGIELVEVASGFRFQVRAEVQPWVARLWAERQTRYSRALLETLALIAYRQPITRGEIEQIRGVAVSTNIIRTLEEREWVRVVGHRDVPGKPALYGTTRTFLDYFGLKSLDQLPPLTELHELPDLEPQLPLEPVAGSDSEGSEAGPVSEPLALAEAAVVADDESAAAATDNADAVRDQPAPSEPSDPDVVAEADDATAGSDQAGFDASADADAVSPVGVESDDTDDTPDDDAHAASSEHIA